MAYVLEPSHDGPMQRAAALEERPRFKLKFPSVDHMHAALATEAPGVEAVVMNERRRSVSFAQSDGEGAFAEGIDVGPNSDLQWLASKYSAKIVPDYRYQPDMQLFQSDIFDAEAPIASASLDHVLARIGVPAAWATSRGEGVTLAIVDTGVHGGHSAFPSNKRAGGWAIIGDDPWTDAQGHGTMCACIATATRSSGGRYDGAAPDALLMSCKTAFFDSELSAIYDTLTDRAMRGERIVASNSFGRRTGMPPEPPVDSDFLSALADAVAAGVIVVFSAGNNHAFAGGLPESCTPNSIWLHKGRDDVLAVATCDLDDRMWDYSSRGPGQHFGVPGTNEKPDVTAPTPRNGRILYGAGERILANGWGTSGAAPQVAGLAALLLSANPRLTRGQLFAIIRDSAKRLGHGTRCEGRGIIDAEAALAAVAGVS